MLQSSNTVQAWPLMATTPRTTKVPSAALKLIGRWVFVGFCRGPTGPGAWVWRQAFKLLTDSNLCCLTFASPLQCPGKVASMTSPWMENTVDWFATTLGKEWDTVRPPQDLMTCWSSHEHCGHCQILWNLQASFLQKTLYAFIFPKRALPFELRLLYRSVRVAVHPPSRSPLQRGTFWPELTRWTKRPRPTPLSPRNPTFIRMSPVPAPSAESPWSTSFGWLSWFHHTVASKPTTPCEPLLEYVTVIAIPVNKVSMRFRGFHLSPSTALFKPGTSPELFLLFQPYENSAIQLNDPNTRVIHLTVGFLCFIKMDWRGKKRKSTGVSNIWFEIWSLWSIKMCSDFVPHKSFPSLLDAQ